MTPVSPRILLLGAGGRLGRVIARLGAPVVPAGRREADFRTACDIPALVEHIAPDVVINAAAFTDVDGAESSESEAMAVNGHAVGLLAAACARRDIPLIHVSTDHVFPSAQGRPWRPEDTPRPLSAYGRSKRLGEDLIRLTGGRYLILRTSWLFGGGGRDFVSTILGRARQGAPVPVVADQIGGPTPILPLAATLLALAHRAVTISGLREIHHFTGMPDVSRADFARAIIASAGLETEVEEVTTDDLAAPARRPLDARLDNTSLALRFGISRPDWRLHLEALADRLKTTAPPPHETAHI